KSAAGDSPTLPVTAFQIFALEVYDDFVRLLQNVSPAQAATLPAGKDSILASRKVERLIQVVREVFEKQPSLGEEMLAALRSPANTSLDPRQSRLLKSVVRMYQGTISPYLNFYGPPGRIHTIPYFKVLQHPQESAEIPQWTSFKGKAVFVGLSELLQPEKKDGFPTVYTQPSGVEISGVEIAATAFANILEDMPVAPLSHWLHLTTVLLWGLMLGIIGLLLPTSTAAASVTGLSALYLSVAHYQFKSVGLWPPLVVPLFFQAPLALIVVFTWKYIRTNRERRNIRRAFGYYLPDKVVDQLAHNLTDVTSNAHLVYGTCLCTDAEKYATLSETMDPKELGAFMNQYYSAIFEPVRQRGGIVSDVVGDSMLAIWATGQPDVALCKQACLTALDIDRAVRHFNGTSSGLQLPTRMGLHSGHMMLGNVGAIDHYEYRAVGDVVNSAVRLEGLNKFLGTQILVSEAVRKQLEDFLVRPLGEFFLAGKSKPMKVYELICCREESSAAQKSLCGAFAEGLRAYRRQSWQEAIRIFDQIQQSFGSDGPSLYYRQLCNEFKKNRPEENWNGAIRLDQK
ncbi:MAG: adenylate/guanylate cyclase domain-containing protein, partial [Desulfobacterales bacterium]